MKDIKIPDDIIFQTMNIWVNLKDVFGNKHQLPSDYFDPEDTWGVLAINRGQIDTFKVIPPKLDPSVDCDEFEDYKYLAKSYSKLALETMDHFLEGGVFLEEDLSIGLYTSANKHQTQFLLSLMALGIKYFHKETFEDTELVDVYNNIQEYGKLFEGNPYMEPDLFMDVFDHLWELVRE